MRSGNRLKAIEQWRVVGTSDSDAMQIASVEARFNHQLRLIPEERDFSGIRSAVKRIRAKLDAASGNGDPAAEDQISYASRRLAFIEVSLPPSGIAAEEQFPRVELFEQPNDHVRLTMGQNPIGNSRIESQQVTIRAVVLHRDRLHVGAPHLGTVTIAADHLHRALGAVDPGLIEVQVMGKLEVGLFDEARIIHRSALDLPIHVPRSAGGPQHRQFEFGMVLLEIGGVVEADRRCALGAQVAVAVAAETLVAAHQYRRFLVLLVARGATGFL